VKKSISRRNFIKKAASAGAIVSFSPFLEIIKGCKKKAPFIKYYPETEKSFPLLKVKGSYYDIGYAIGNNFGEEINKVFHRRNKWFTELKYFASNDDDNLFEKLMINTKKYYPHLLEELKGIARGANIKFEDLFILNIHAELNTKRKLAKEPIPGCSTIYLINKNEKILFHNEDNKDMYKDIMFMVKATPPSDVTFIVLVYPGSFIGNGPGINSYGIAQTTNYIAGMKLKTGIPRYVLNRAVLEAKTLDEAVKIVTNPKNAFAYHHNLASFREKKILSVEVTPYSHQIFEPASIYYHTNHLILDETKTLPQNTNYVNSSSMTRYNVITKKIDELPEPDKVMEKDVIEILSSHKGAPYSPCRHPENDVTGRTLATAQIDIIDKKMKIYKGNPCIAYNNSFVTDYKF